MSNDDDERAFVAALTEFALNPSEAAHALEERVTAARDPLEQLRVEMLAAALDYAASGQPVFPCYPATPTGFREEVSKHPLNGVRWRDRATTDADEIRRWWRRWPYAIGLPTGLLYDVLDIDHKPGRPNGYRVLGRLDEEGLLIGVVRWVKTPSGGCHAYFGVNGDPKQAMGNASYAHVGVDLRGLGGYVIAPPSYVESGTGTGFYRVLADDLSPREPLDWRRLDELLRLRPHSRSSAGQSQSQSRGAGAAGPGAGGREAADPDRLTSELVEEMGAAEPGARNSTLFRKACTAIEFGLDIEGLIAAAIETGLDEHEVRRTVASAEDRIARQQSHQPTTHEEEARA
jgi:Bifunctional DNA primase/polymerase, N-terminal